MHKILIVDDDRIIRKGLASTISWEEYEYQLVGEAADGEQGLEMIKNLRPDIVISDIKMPFMDGLSMVRSGRELFPDMKAILLTGYDDFAYAREAIKIKAFDYLLKPVDKEVLLEKVKKASEELKTENAAKQKISEGMPFLRLKLLKKIISGKFSGEKLLGEARSLGVNLAGPKYLVFVIKIDDYYKMSAQAMEAAEGKEVAKHCVFDLCEKVIAWEGKGCVFELERDELVVVYEDSKNDAAMMETGHALAEHISALVKQCINVTVTIALGGVCQSLDGVGVSYREARAAMQNRHFIGKDSIFSFFDIGVSGHEGNLQMSDLELELLRKIKLGFPQEALAVVNKIEKELLQHKGLSLANVRLMSVQLLISLFKGAKEWAGEWEKANQANLQLYHIQISGMQTIKEIMNLIRKTVSSLTDHIQVKRDSSKCVAIEQAVKYIEENFTKQGLSLHEVAKHIHMNPVYMSALFKQEKNITFSEFLLQARMNRAMELLRRQNMRTYEVAENVGYSNPEYFSVCFKKYVGVSPLEFKNKV